MQNVTWQHLCLGSVSRLPLSGGFELCQRMKSWTSFLKIEVSLKLCSARRCNSGNFITKFSLQHVNTRAHTHTHTNKPKPTPNIPNSKQLDAVSLIKNIKFKSIHNTSTYLCSNKSGRSGTGTPSTIPWSSGDNFAKTLEVISPSSCWFSNISRIKSISSLGISVSISAWSSSDNCERMATFSVIDNCAISTQKSMKLPSKLRCDKNSTHEKIKNIWSVYQYSAVRWIDNKRPTSGPHACRPSKSTKWR